MVFGNNTKNLKRTLEEKYPITERKILMNWNKNILILELKKK